MRDAAERIISFPATGLTLLSVRDVMGEKTAGAPAEITLTNRLHAVNMETSFQHRYSGSGRNNE